MFNYDAPDERWSADVKASFEKYMQDGGGLVSVHAADNAFPNWTAFNEMIGVGGWRSRTEKAGPLWYYKDGKLVSDNTPGRPAATGSARRFRSRCVKTIPLRMDCRSSGCIRVTSCTPRCAVLERT